MKRHLKESGSIFALIAACLSVGVAPALAQEDEAGDEAVIVLGVRQSIESSIDEKRRSNEIIDTITAEDIGQLANDNISEALQRITGVQVTRSDDGEGQGVQIRGLSENNVQLNGETVSGTAADRGVNFQDLPAELFAGVEILKTLSADAIEGSLGGTINLRTRAPLDGRREFVANLSNTYKYAEVGDLENNDVSALVIRQFNDTRIGDFGVLLNFGYKETASVAEVYGGGDFDDAPGIWIRRTGADIPQNNPNSANGQFNFFYQPTVSGQSNAYQYDLNEDPNGDGFSDANDVYYIPGQFGFFERARDDEKNSLNGTLQWQPISTLDIRFDTVLTDIEESITGASYSINFNVPRAGPLIGGAGNEYTLLANTPTFGDVYLLESGRLASATNRVGAAPSQNTVERESQQYSLEADWQVMPSLNVYVKGSTSSGEAHTVVQGQLSTGIEQQGGNAATFNAQDFYNFVDFDLTSGRIPDVTFYENPFPAANYGVTAQVPVANLVVLDPTDINYVRQRYFQYQRNAADTENNDDSIRLDLTWEPTAPWISAVKGGARWAERGFARASYQNSNQNAGVYSAYDGVRPPAQTVNIQRIPVNPSSTTDVDAAATSEFLQSCLTSAGGTDLLSQFPSNLPRTWDSTQGCDILGIQDYFNMIDIRAINPSTGAGYYEQIAERFDVTEETMAVYLQADFLGALSDVAVYGNVGLRYVETETTSRGYIRNVANTGFDFVTLPGKYDDLLPTANVNFGLSDDVILRLAYSRTLGRPGLNLISPALDITRSDVDPNYAGFGTAGNPNLEAVHSDNIDVSLEWYYAKGGFLSVAVFQKDIDSTIFLGSDPVDYQIGDELFSIRTYDNFGGTKINGIEFGMAHPFDYLPGIMRHTGVTANYTIVNEASDLIDQEGDPISRKGLSDKTLNLGAYYDDNRFSARLAYNWRSDFTRRENVTLGFNRPEALPEIEAAREQLDLALRYRFNEHFRVTFNAINLTDSGTERYIKYPELVNYLAFAGRRFNLGASLSF